MCLEVEVGEVMPGTQGPSGRGGGVGGVSLDHREVPWPE